MPIFWISTRQGRTRIHPRRQHIRTWGYDFSSLKKGVWRYLILKDVTQNSLTSLAYKIGKRSEAAIMKSRATDRHVESIQSDPEAHQARQWHRSDPRDVSDRHHGHPHLQPLLQRSQGNPGSLPAPLRLRLQEGLLHTS